MKPRRSDRGVCVHLKAKEEEEEEKKDTRTTMCDSHGHTQC